MIGRSHFGDLMFKNEVSKEQMREAIQTRERWKEIAQEYSGSGDAIVINGYKYIIAALFVLDCERREHHFRLAPDGRAEFIQRHEHPQECIVVDPMTNPCRDTVYESDGIPPAVTQVLEELDLTPTWNEACEDGCHEFIIVNRATPYEFVRCQLCHLSRHTLSWMGHNTPEGKTIDE